jgi:thiol:disulfide interchange protein
MTQSDMPITKAPTCIGCGGARWRTWIVLAGFLLLVGYVQWPMFKGLYYRAFGAPAPNDGIAWRMDLGAALAESAQTGKPVLVDFSASWCPPCQVMKHESWPDAQVAKAANDNFIPVFLDADASGSQAPAEKYGIRAIPSVLVLDSQGKVLRQANFLDAAALRKFLTAP